MSSQPHCTSEPWPWNSSRLLHESNTLSIALMKLLLLLVNNISAYCVVVMILLNMRMPRNLLLNGNIDLYFQRSIWIYLVRLVHWHDQPDWTLPPRLLKALQVEVWPTTRVVALGPSLLARPLLDDPSLANTVHTLYLAHNPPASTTEPNGCTSNTTAVIIRFTFCATRQHMTCYRTGGDTVYR